MKDERAISEAREKAVALRDEVIRLRTDAERFAAAKEELSEVGRFLQVHDPGYDDWARSVVASEREGAQA